MNNKFNVGVYVFASILGFVAGGLFSKTRISANDIEEVDTLFAELEMLEPES